MEFWKFQRCLRFLGRAVTGNAAICPGNPVYCDIGPGAVTCKLVSAQAVTGNAAICPGNPVHCDIGPGAVTCKLVSAPPARGSRLSQFDDDYMRIVAFTIQFIIYMSFWCSNDVSGGQSKIFLRRLQQEWFLSLDIDIYREGRCKLSNAAAGQPVTQQPRGVYPYRRETVISVCGFSFMASSQSTLEFEE